METERLSGSVLCTYRNPVFAKFRLVTYRCTSKLDIECAEMAWFQHTERFLTILNIHAPKILAWYNSEFHITSRHRFDPARMWCAKRLTLRRSGRGDRIIYNSGDRSRNSILFRLLEYFQELPGPLQNLLATSRQVTTNEKDLCSLIYERLTLDTWDCRVNLSNVFATYDFTFTVQNPETQYLLNQRTQVSWIDFARLVPASLPHMSKNRWSSSCVFISYRTVDGSNGGARHTNAEYQACLKLLVSRENIITPTTSLGCSKNFRFLQTLFLHDTFHMKAIWKLPLVEEEQAPDYNQQQHVEDSMVRNIKLAMEIFNGKNLPYAAAVALPSFLVDPAAMTAEQTKTLKFMAYACEHPFIDYLSNACVVADGTYTAISPYHDIRSIKRETYEALQQWKGGIIANETGSGKTLCVLASITSSSLVIVPDNLVTHWKTQIEKHTSLLLAPTEITDYALVLGKSSQVPTKQYSRPPLVTIISRSVIRSQRWGTFRQENYHQLFIDEGHNLSGTATISAIENTAVTGARWIVSATPYTNFPLSLSILGLSKIFQETGMIVINPVNICAIPFLQQSVCQEKTVLPENIHISKQVIFCENVASEFYDEIPAILKQVNMETVSTKGIRKFFRILERVAAGGILNTKLMLEVAKRYLITEKKPGDKRQREPLTVLKQVAPAAFNTANDTCAVCLDNFTEPLQLMCNHVYCRPCLEAILQVGISKCPTCRASLGPSHSHPVRVMVPTWAVLLSPVSEEKMPRELSKKEYQSLLEGDVRFDETKHVYMDEKLQKFKQKFDHFLQQPNGRLVVFVKREIPAMEYIAYTKAHSVSCLLAGLQSMSQSTSTQNIEKFRSDTSIRVLVLTLKFSAGFDLNTASHLWIMDYDLHSAKIEQCKGRCMRLGQCNDRVEIISFLYRNTFDHFLHAFQHIGVMNPTKSNLMLFKYFILQHDSSSVFSDIATISRRVTFAHTITASSTTIYVGPYCVNVQTGRVKRSKNANWGTSMHNFLRYL